MAKKSRKRLARNQSGCMGSLINIFDFRQGRSPQKLLSDRKRGSKLVGTSYPDIQLESVSDAREICIQTSEPVVGGTPTIDSSKLSVKELMHEEMCGKHDQTRHGSIAKGDAKPNVLGEDQGIKHHRRARSKASLELDTHSVISAKSLVAERPSHQKHKSASSVDLNVMVEELCSRIHQNDVSFLKHGQDEEVTSQPFEDPSVLKEKLWEATKVLLNHFAEGRKLPNDGASQPVKECVNALQILDSHKEVFLKLLQDPDSHLVKNLQDIQVEEGKVKMLTESNLLEHDIGNSKQQSFFWRRFKSPERSSSKKTDTSQVSNKIVLLKPGPPGLRKLDMASTCGSLLESPQRMKNFHQIERGSSTFSFSEFKRKLKHAMRKEQHGNVQNEMSYQHLYEQPKLSNHDKKVGENVGMASPSREHFFVERIPKFSVSVTKVDKTRKPKVGKSNLENDTVFSPEQRVSSIYAEAKKHLAEIVVTSNEDGDTLGKQAHKSLGRMISYSGYSSPTICSPRKEKETSSDREACIDKTCQDTPENNVKLPDKQCIAEGQVIHDNDIPAFEPHVSDGLACEISVDKHTHELELPISEDIVRSPDVESQKVSKMMGPFLEPSSLQSIEIDEVGSSSTPNCSEHCNSANMKQDTHTEHEPCSSPSASTHVCSMTEWTESVDAMSDGTSKPSPISVLEPMFKEKDISPAVKLLTAEKIQPRQIRFEEEILTPSKQVSCNRTCTQDDKYTIEFVKAVVQMSGLTWDELLRRSFLADHLIEPSLIDEVDFLPDLLPCDFNLLFDLINEILIEICRLNFNCILLFAKTFVQPKLKGKDIFTEIWKGVEWHLKLEGSPHSLDKIIANDLINSRTWMDLQLDRESVGIHLQHVILEELLEDTILNCVTGNFENELPVLPLAESVDNEIDDVEL